MCAARESACVCSGCMRVVVCGVVCAGCVNIHLDERVLTVCVVPFALCVCCCGEMCRRFTAIVHELKRQGHDVVVFTLESEPQGIEGIRYYVLNYEYIAAYPGKKVGQPSFHNFMVISNALKHEKPAVLHPKNGRAS